MGLAGDEAGRVPDGTVDVLVGDSFGGFNDAAPTEIGVPGGTVCLPGSTPAQAPAAPVAP